MASTYTELIERLRRVAKTERLLELEDKGVAESGHADMLDKAADAIETLSNGINVYADEAFKRAQECADLRRRIEELIDKYAEKAADTPAPAPAPSPVILYICDRRACDSCHPDCMYTSDIRHACSFNMDGKIMREFK